MENRNAGTTEGVAGQKGAAPTPASLTGRVAPRPPRGLEGSALAEATIADILTREFGRSPGAIVREIMRTAAGAGDTYVPVEVAFDAAKQSALDTRKAVLESLRGVLTELFADQAASDEQKQRWIDLVLKRVGG